MHRRMRLANGWVLVVVVALGGALQGCTDPTTAAPDHLEIVAGYVDVGDAPTGAGELSGPHFDLAIDEVATTTVLKGAHADYLDLAAPLQAAPGHEFVLARLPPSVEPPRFERTSENVQEALLVGDQRRPLVDVLDRLAQYVELTLVVSVPRGAPVILQITDEGRPLSLDVRTGDVAPDSTYRVEYSQEFSPRDYGETGTVEAFGRTRPLKVEIFWSSGYGHSLEPFVPSAGWAPPGRSWLLIQGPLRASSSTVLDYGIFGFGLVFDLDLAATFGLAQPDGPTTRAEAPQLLRVNDTSGMGPASGFSVVFDVADSFRSGTLRITPDGPMTAFLDDDVVDTGWATPPAPAEIPIAF